jgi:hypothetical protein
VDGKELSLTTQSAPSTATGLRPQHCNKAESVSARLPAVLREAATAIMCNHFNSLAPGRHTTGPADGTLHPSTISALPDACSISCNLLYQQEFCCCFVPYWYLAGTSCCKACQMQLIHKHLTLKHSPLLKASSRSSTPCCFRNKNYAAKAAVPQQGPIAAKTLCCSYQCYAAATSASCWCNTCRQHLTLLMQ